MAINLGQGSPLKSIMNMLGQAGAQHTAQANQRTNLTEQGFDIAPQELPDNPLAKIMSILGGPQSLDGRVTPNATHPSNVALEKQRMVNESFANTARQQSETARLAEEGRQKRHVETIAADERRENKRVEAEAKKQQRIHLKELRTEMIEAQKFMATLAQKNQLTPSEMKDALDLTTEIDNRIEGIAEGTMQDWLLPDFFPGGEEFVIGKLTDKTSIWYNPGAARQIEELQRMKSDLMNTVSQLPKLRGTQTGATSNNPDLEIEETLDVVADTLSQQAMSGTQTSLGRIGAPANLFGGGTNNIESILAKLASQKEAQGQRVMQQTMSGLPQHMLEEEGF